MIREPYSVFPYNTTIDPTINNEFYFNFNGDQLRKYDIKILENNNKNNVIKDFTSLVSLEETVYNDEKVTIPFKTNLTTTLGKDLIWKMRLVENNGDWSANNIPTMKMSNSTLKKQGELQFKGKIVGQMENLSTEDLKQICVSVKTDNGSIFKTVDYESRYYEYYSLGKGAYYIGSVISEGDSDIYYWVEKTISKNGSQQKTWVTRTDVNKEKILLKDQTGIYQINNLFTQTEFNSTFKNSSVTYEKEQTLADNTVKVLEDFGYNETPQQVFFVNSIINTGSGKYSNRVTRKSVGLTPYIYLKYKKSTDQDYYEKAFDNIFTSSEFDQLQGYSIVFQLYSGQDKPPANYKLVKEVSFEEESQILYTIEENLVNYGSKLLSQFNKGQIDTYPVETTEQINRKHKLLKNFSLLLKDENGNIFSSEYMFTKDELDSIEDENYSIFYLSKLQTSATLIDEDNYQVYRNYYDTNYYYFQARKKPQVIFADENHNEISGEELNIDSRYYKFTVKNQDEINTKYYFWTLFRNDQVKPVAQTDKTFSQNIYYEYDNFLNDYNYKLVLSLETQEGAKYDYIIDNIIIDYDEQVKMNCKAEVSYSSEGGYASVIWPTQKLSIPTIEPPDGISDDKTWGSGGKFATQIDEGCTITYDNLMGEQLKIDPNNFILHTCFSVHEKEYKNYPKTFDLIELKSFDNTSFLKIVKDGFTFKIVTSKTGEEGVALYKVDIKNQNISNKYRDILFSALKIFEKYDFTKTYVKTDNIYNHFILPSKTELISQRTNYLYETDTNLDYSRYKLFISKLGAVLVHYKKASTNWVIDSYYIIDNTDGFSKFDIKPAYFNKAILYGNTSFKYFILYKLKDIKTLITQQEQGCLDINWSPNWDVLSSEKIISINFEEGVKSSYNVDFDGTVKSYRVYRNEFSDIDKNQLIERKLIAEFTTEFLNKINNNTSYIIKDYTQHNRGYYNYQITPKIETIENSQKVIKVLGKSIESDVIHVNEYSWYFTQLGKKDDGTYAPIDQFKFYLNLNEGQVQRNIQKVFHNGFGKYPKVSIGVNNYLTADLSCLIGEFYYRKNFSYSGKKVISDALIKQTSTDNLLKLFVKESQFLENLNIETDYVSINMRGQSRQVINYSFDYVNGEKQYYIIIDQPFLNFVPGAKYKDYDLIIVKDKNNQDNYTKVSEYNEYIDDITIIKRWNDFINSNNPILIKDIKGNCFIGAVSNSIENYDNAIDQMPTTISFTVTEIDDINNYIVFEY